jgi:hypothetical protein
VGLIVGLGLLGAAGCGQEGPLPQVQGQVFYHGRALPGGTIVFTPDPERGGRGELACGEIQPDGRYVLHTGEDLGAVAGWHRVTVAAAPATGLPRKYRDPELSGQSCEVKAGQLNTIDLHLD